MADSMQKPSNNTGRGKPSGWMLFFIGLGLALSASVINIAFVRVGFRPWMKANIAANGYGGSTDLTLGLFIMDFLFYPILLFFYLAIVIPLLFSYAFKTVPGLIVLVILLLLPTISIYFMWISDDEWYWFFTVPAVACTFAATLVMLLVARRFVANRLS